MQNHFLLSKPLQRRARVLAALLLAACASQTFAAPAEAPEKPAAKPAVANAKTEVSAEPERTLLLDNFEGGTVNWAVYRIAPATGFGIDLESKTEITTKATQVKNGKGSLSCIYTSAAGRGSLIALERPTDLTGMKSARFWIRCDAATSFVFALRESGGARYQKMFFVPANSWRRITLDLSELKRADDSPDANGKLDLNQIAGTYLMDLAGLLLPLAPGQDGSRLLWLDDVEFSSRSARSLAKDGEKLLEDFESGAADWIPLTISTDSAKVAIAAAGLDIAEEKDAKNHVLLASYDRKKGIVNGWLHPIQGADLRGTSEVSLRLKTSSDATLLLVVAQHDGSRYETPIELRADDGWKTATHKLSDLKRAGGSPTGDGKLLPERIKEITLADVSGALPTLNPASKNTLSIDDVRFQ